MLLVGIAYYITGKVLTKCPCDRALSAMSARSQSHGKEQIPNLKHQILDKSKIQNLSEHLRFEF